MRDYPLDLSRIATAIVADPLGTDIKTTTNYSSDGNSIVMEFEGLPVYGSTKKGKALVTVPRSVFKVQNGKVNFGPLQQAHCKYYLNSIGNAYPHPHIFSDGHPCWDNSQKERVGDFICNIIETLTLQNVTRDSVMIGHCASGVMGTGETAITNAQKQQKAVIQALHCKPMISDRRKLEEYVNKRWCNKITMLVRA